MAADRPSDSGVESRDSLSNRPAVLSCMYRRLCCRGGGDRRRSTSVLRACHWPETETQAPLASYAYLPLIVIFSHGKLAGKSQTVAKRQRYGLSHTPKEGWLGAHFS